MKKIVQERLMILFIPIIKFFGFENLKWLQIRRLFFSGPLGRIIVSFNVKLLKGPRKVPDSAKVVAVCLLRNASFYVKVNAEHHFSLGVDHFIFLDNGSTDETVSEIQKLQNVTLLSCHLPFKRYQWGLRHYIQQFPGTKNKWVLHIDADELFDYPDSDKIDLKQFVLYQERRKFTSVTTQMLDMFPNKLATEKRFDNETDYTKIDNCFSLDKLRALKIPYSNVYSNSAIEILRGGVRKRKFELDSLLTKHPLQKMNGKVKRVDCHFVIGAHISDVSAVLRHYKFAGDFRERVKDAIYQKQYWGESYDYHRYQKGLGKNGVDFSNIPANTFVNARQLVELGFLKVSDEFDFFIHQNSKN